MTDSTPIWPFGFFSARREGERIDDYRRRLSQERVHQRELASMTPDEWQDALQRFMDGIEDADHDEL